MLWTAATQIVGATEPTNLFLVPWPAAALVILTEYKIETYAET